MYPVNDDIENSVPNDHLPDEDLSLGDLADHTDRNQEELDVVSRDSMKAAFLAVQLDALSIAQSLKNLISAKADRDKLKAIEIVLKVRGDFAQSAVDERPIRITFGKEMTEVEVDNNPGT